MGSNPTPSAISVSSAFRGFPVQTRGKIGQLSVKVSVTLPAVPEFFKIPHNSAILRHCSLSVFSSCPGRKGTNAKPIHSIPSRRSVLLRRRSDRPAKKFADEGRRRSAANCPSQERRGESAANELGHGQDLPVRAKPKNDFSGHRVVDLRLHHGGQRQHRQRNHQSNEFGFHIFVLIRFKVSFLLRPRFYCTSRKNCWEPENRYMLVWAEPASIPNCMAPATATPRRMFLDFIGICYLV